MNYYYIEQLKHYIISHKMQSIYYRVMSMKCSARINFSYYIVINKILSAAHTLCSIFCKWLISCCFSYDSWTVHANWVNNISLSDEETYICYIFVAKIHKYLWQCSLEKPLKQQHQQTFSFILIMEATSMASINF